jgi:hypothetical protein
MKELLGVAIAFALFLGASALAVDVLGDRDGIVPPPDAVAEQFTRAVMAKRWEPAKEYLVDPESRSEDDLEELQRGLGEQQNVEAEVVARNETRAVVTVRVPENDAVMNLALVFDGEWKIE